jgi:hypothetical protein
MNNKEVPEGFFFDRGDDASALNANEDLHQDFTAAQAQVPGVVGRALTIEAQVVGTTKPTLVSTPHHAIIDMCLHMYPLGQPIHRLPQL